jgi:hypothetical protein
LQPAVLIAGGLAGVANDSIPRLGDLTSPLLGRPPVPHQHTRDREPLLISNDPPSSIRLPHPSPPRPASGRRTNRTNMEIEEGEQTLGLLTEILGGRSSGAISDRRSSLPRRLHHQTHRILPRRSGARLPNDGIQPKTQDLNLSTEPAPPPPHLRPAAPPEKGRVRPGRPRSTGRGEDGDGEGGRRREERSGSLFRAYCGCAIFLDCWMVVYREVMIKQLK